MSVKSQTKYFFLITNYLSEQKTLYLLSASRSYYKWVIIPEFFLRVLVWRKNCPRTKIAESQRIFSVHSLEKLINANSIFLPNDFHTMRKIRLINRKISSDLNEKFSSSLSIKCNSIKFFKYIDTNRELRKFATEWTHPPLILLWKWRAGKWKVGNCSETFSSCRLFLSLTMMNCSFFTSSHALFSHSLKDDFYLESERGKIEWLSHCLPSPYFFFLMRWGFLEKEWKFILWFNNFFF